MSSLETTVAKVEPNRWFKKPWVWAVIVVLVAIGGIGNVIGGPTGDEPAARNAHTQVNLPDLTGQSGDAAREELQRLGLLVAFDAGDESVWNAENWMVESQDPAAGKVPAGTTVTLFVGRPSPEPWTGIADGTWAGGDKLIGEPVRSNVAVLTGNFYWDFEFRVTGPPTLTSTDGGKTVKISSPLSVSRIQAAWPEQQFEDQVSFIFMAGATPEDSLLDETYGVHIRTECVDEELAIGETTECTVAFTTEPGAIQDSYWWVGRTFAVAAWPGQTR